MMFGLVAGSGGSSGDGASYTARARSTQAGHAVGRALGTFGVCALFLINRGLPGKLAIGSFFRFFGFYRRTCDARSTIGRVKTAVLGALEYAPPRILGATLPWSWGR